MLVVIFSPFSMSEVSQSFINIKTSYVCFVIVLQAMRATVRSSCVSCITSAWTTASRACLSTPTVYLRYDSSLWEPFKNQLKVNELLTRPWTVFKSEMFVYMCPAHANAVWVWWGGNWGRTHLHLHQPGCKQEECTTYMWRYVNMSCILLIF